jgi:hypothetical protein
MSFLPENEKTMPCICRFASHQDLSAAWMEKGVFSKKNTLCLSKVSFQ